MWQFGIIAAVVIFGIKIGLAMGFAGIKHKTGALIILGYGVGLTTLSLICQPYTNQIYQLVYGYSSAIFAVIAFIILITGFETVRQWKQTGRDYGTATCMAMVAPCPCCFGAILASIILVSPAMGLTSILLGVYSSLGLMLIMGTTYILSRSIVKFINKPFPLIIGNFMIFMGLYFILAIMILPNMVYVTQGTSITIQSTSYLIYMLIAVILLMGLGALIAKKRSSLLQYSK